MIQPQYVYRATNFIFDNGGKPKPKYFVVFHIDAESTLLLSLTTSQPKSPGDLDNESTEGCIYFNDDRGYGHAFVWKPDQPIGTNGFYFPLRTSLQFEFRSQLITLPSTGLAAKVTHTVEECCCLTDEVFSVILRCLLGSKYLSKNQRIALQDRLATLS